MQIHLPRIQQYAIGSAPQPLQGFEHHEGVAEVGTAGCVLAVGVAGPIDGAVAEGGRVVVVGGEGAEVRGEEEIDR